MNFICLRKYIFLFLVSTVTLVSCQNGTNQNKADDNNLTKFVDPFIGSGGHGHVFVGANVPFGGVQVGQVIFIKVGIGHHHIIIQIV